HTVSSARCTSAQPDILLINTSVQRGARNPNKVVPLLHLWRRGSKGEEAVTNRNRYAITVMPQNDKDLTVRADWPLPAPSRDGNSVEALRKIRGVKIIVYRRARDRTGTHR